MNDYKFGNFIFNLRTEKGLSQAQLGERLGVSNKAVSKWEMGVSKPRPEMLITLASLFDVTVDELLAGERNAESKKAELKASNDNIIKLWADEYLKKKRHGNFAVLTAVLLPIILLIWVVVIVSLNRTDKLLGPIGMVVIFFAEVIDIPLIFVFHGSARRLKRILYATYNEQSEEISAIILQKKRKVSRIKVDGFLAYDNDAEMQNDDIKDDFKNTIKLCAYKYLKRKKLGYFTVLTAILLPIVFFIWISVVISFNLIDKTIAPIIAIVIIFAEIITIVLFFVFYGSALRLKHNIYAAYPAQSEEISAIISPKKENIPMLKWEKISCIVSTSIIFLCATIRFVVLCVIESNNTLRIINIAVIIPMLLASILSIIAYVHYLIRIHKIMKQK